MPHRTSRCTVRLYCHVRGIFRLGSMESIEAIGASADAAPPPGDARLPFSNCALSEYGGLLTSGKYRLPYGRSKNRPTPLRMDGFPPPSGFPATLRRGATFACDL